MGTSPVPEKQCVNFQYIQRTKSIKLMISNVIYHRQVPVEEYYLSFLKPAGSPTVYYLRPHTIKEKNSSIRILLLMVRFFIYFIE